MASSGEPTGPTGEEVPVGEPDVTAAVFDAERPRLVGLAYRMTGSRVDAEDIVQEAWFRWERVDRAGIERPAAWLTTVVSRLSIDRLRARRRQREDYVGPWLPEPILVPDRAGPTGPLPPDQHAELADSLSTAFLVLLESLSPTERLVVLLVDVFGEPFAAVAGVVGRSEQATRQVAVRARRKLSRDGPALAGSLARPAPAEQRARAEAFVAAIFSGDEEAMARLVAPDVVLVSDGGGRVRAARRPVLGRDRVVRFVVNLARRVPPGTVIDWGWVNGRPALVGRLDGTIDTILEFEVADGLVVGLRSYRNPDKMATADRPVILW